MKGDEYLTVVVFSKYEKGGSEEPPQNARVLLALSRGLGRGAGAVFFRFRVVDLADVVGLDRESLVFHAVCRVGLRLDLALNDDRRSGLRWAAIFTNGPQT